MNTIDWAELEAERVNRLPVKTVGQREELIASALRKAKAEGYAMGFNETAKWMKDECEGVLRGRAYAPEPFIMKVMARISQIENGDSIPTENSVEPV